MSEAPRAEGPGELRPAVGQKPQGPGVPGRSAGRRAGARL